MTLESDKSGNFSVTNIFGNSIEFASMEKEGYKLSPKQVKSSYLYYPTVVRIEPDKPEIFHMWKKAGEESLISSAWHGKLICDGTLRTYDLLSGKPTKEGILQITCTRKPLDLVPREHKPYDYELKISVIGGGIQKTDDEFTYLAPEGGYLQSLTLGAKAGDPKWIGNVKQEFYIKTSEGHYGRLSVDWYAEFTSPTHLEWDCTINPSGSRNLER